MATKKTSAARKQRAAKPATATRKSAPAKRTVTKRAAKPKAAKGTASPKRSVPGRKAVRKAARTGSLAATASPSVVLDQIGTLLESYATRGVFKGFSRGPASGKRGGYRVLWHRDRFYDLEVDLAKAALHIPQLLPEVPARSEMDREFRQYIESRHALELPEHRRISREKAELTGGNRGGVATLTMTVKDGDYEYAVRKLVHAVHEVFLDFLSEGKYYEWQIEVFDLDPDRP